MRMVIGVVKKGKIVEPIVVPRGESPWTPETWDYFLTLEMVETRRRLALLKKKLGSQGICLALDAIEQLIDLKIKQHELLEQRRRNLSSNLASSGPRKKGGTS